jgi:toxin ParE1/3/4
LKRRQVIFSPEAREDLLQLGDWIAERAGVDIALRYIDRVESFCAGLAFSSERGQRRDDIRPGLCIVGFERRIAVAFTVTPTEVTILRLYYGGRGWDTAP